MGINKRFAQWLSVNSYIKPGWQVRQTKPVGYISLHYRAATGCQVTDARPRVQCVILEQRLPANYQPRQHAAIKKRNPECLLS